MSLFVVVLSARAVCFCLDDDVSVNMNNCNHWDLFGNSRPVKICLSNFSQSVALVIIVCVAVVICQCLFVIFVKLD